MQIKFLSLCLVEDENRLKDYHHNVFEGIGIFERFQYTRVKPQKIEHLYDPRVEESQELYGDDVEKKFRMVQGRESEGAAYGFHELGVVEYRQDDGEVDTKPTDGSFQFFLHNQ